jgi:hypothetical protein
MGSTGYSVGMGDCLVGYQGGKLNVVDAAIVDIIGSLIRTAPKQKDS